jgi:hypothetical protein
MEESARQNAANAEKPQVVIDQEELNRKTAEEAKRLSEESARQNEANAEKPQAVIDQQELNRKTVEEAKRLSEESAGQNAATNEATNEANQEASMEASSQRQNTATTRNDILQDSAASPPPPCPPYEEAACQFSGNQHLTTYHGERYDFMGVGVFTMAKLDDVEVQGFLCPAVESEYPFAFRGVSYVVALAIRKASRTLILDEKDVVTLPDGMVLQPEQRRVTSALEEGHRSPAEEGIFRGASALEERHGSAGAGAFTFTAARFASQATGAWAWNISWQDGNLLAHQVDASNHSLTGGVEVGWLTLGGESALSRAEGLCARPCASTSTNATVNVGGVELDVNAGGCQNTACQRMDLDPAANSAVLFDATTLARLEGACQTAGTKPPVCSAEEQVDSTDSPGLCVVGSKGHVLAQAACAPLDSAACAAHHDDCVKDHCAGWPTAVEAHADACRLGEELEETHALHLPARAHGCDTSAPPLASEQQQHQQQQQQQQQQASQPPFESWRQKQASQQQVSQQQALPWLRQQASQQQQALPWLNNQAWQQARQQQQQASPRDVSRSTAPPQQRKEEEQVQSAKERPQDRRKQKRHDGVVDEQQASRGEPHSAEYMCKVLGRCPEGATPAFSHKFPEHTAEYMCKRFGKQCDPAGAKQASQQQAVHANEEDTVRDDLRDRRALKKVEAPTTHSSPVSAADAALRKAIEAGTLDGLMDAIHANADTASPAAVEEARALRDKLRDAKHAAAAVAQQQAQQQAPSLLSRLRLLPPEEAAHLEEVAQSKLDEAKHTRRLRKAEPASNAAALAEWRRNRLQGAVSKGAVATEGVVAPAAELGEQDHGAFAEKLHAADKQKVLVEGGQVA